MLLVEIKDPMVIPMEHPKNSLEAALSKLTALEVEPPPMKTMMMSGQQGIHSENTLGSPLASLTLETLMERPIFPSLIALWQQVWWWCQAQVWWGSILWLRRYMKVGWCQSHSQFTIVGAIQKMVPGWGGGGRAGEFLQMHFSPPKLDNSKGLSNIFKLTTY